MAHNKVNIYNNHASKAADDIYDSLYFNKKIEVWKVHLDRVRSDGKVYAEYMRGIVSEDSNDNDADDHSTRDATFTIEPPSVIYSRAALIHCIVPT